ncbi:MAG: hypothetical protein Q8K64_08085 [Sediminibacterium sp.]|nr:MAG: hypothetical protein FD183_335 [Chitinophagaceae bacterium]MDP1843364.1 hypothetical protein [Sediminibacterium sp.]TXT33363.1 MAG: hypothetical protein FD136_934 [Chitinophagaceae bacterium]
MFKILFWCLMIYLAYRFIFELVVPVTKTASQLKKKMSEMQQQQAFQQKQYAQYNAEQKPEQAKPTNSTPPKRDDYIEFEEVK